MNKQERKKLSDIQNQIQVLTIRLEEIQKVIKKKEKHVFDKFPGSPTGHKLEWESDNLESVIEELALANAFLRQALEGER